MKEGYLQITLTVPLTKTKNKSRTNKYLMVIFSVTILMKDMMKDIYLNQPTIQPINQIHMTSLLNWITGQDSSTIGTVPSE